MMKKSVDDELIDAAANGDVERVRELLKAGANVHTNDDRAFRYAAYHGHTECVRELINAGADVHVFDNDALRFAAIFMHTMCVQELCKNAVYDAKSIMKLIQFLMEKKYFDVIPILLVSVKCEL